MPISNNPAAASNEQQLPRAENYTHIGSYATSPFGTYFWTTWYSPELGSTCGIQLPSSGWLQFGGKHVFYRTDLIVPLFELYKTRADAKDASFYRNILKQAANVFSNAQRFSDTYPTNGQSVEENFNQLCVHAHEILFFWCVGWQLSTCLEYVVEDAAQRVGVNAADLLSQLTTENTPLGKQQREMRNLIALLKQEGIWSPHNLAGVQDAIANNAKLKHIFQRHVDTYAWILNINWSAKRLTLEALLDQMTHVSDDNNSEDQTDSVGLGKLSDLHSILAAATLNQTGSEQLSMFAHSLIPLLNDVAAKLGITYEELMLLMPTEVLVDGRFCSNAQEHVMARKNGNWFIYTASDNNATVLDDGLTVQNLANKFLPKLQVVQQDVVQGIAASTGQAKGRARIIRSAADFHKLSRGEILVTEMTTPDFVITMQKSAAIVTDMGGLLSHAAIVSRELKKPCVIGTKIGTQVLHDGDLVEVDAERGIVTVLQRAGANDVPEVGEQPTDGA